MITLQELRENSLKKIGGLFDILDQENLLVKNSRVVETSFVKNFDRVYDMQYSLDRRKKIFQDEKEFKEFLQKNAKYGITEKNFMFDFRVSSAHYLLSLQELISRFLMEILDIETLQLNKERATLGTTIRKIAEYRDLEGKPVFIENGLRKIFNVKMRNTIGHDKWWFDENNNFCMEGEEPFTEEEFYGEIIASSVLLSSIAISYMTKKFPESLKQLMREIDSYSQDKNQQDFKNS